jgi:hypothetical protein
MFLKLIFYSEDPVAEMKSVRKYLKNKNFSWVRIQARASLKSN